MFHHHPSKGGSAPCTHSFPAHELDLFSCLLSFCATKCLCPISHHLLIRHPSYTKSLYMILLQNHLHEDMTLQQQQQQQTRASLELPVEGEEMDDHSNKRLQALHYQSMLMTHKVRPYTLYMLRFSSWKTRVSQSLILSDVCILCFFNGKGGIIYQDT